MVQQAGYGSWRSPITADLVVTGSLRLGQMVWDQGDLYWTEGRPQEKGRNVLMRRSADGILVELTPAPFNVRTRVHEYGGGAYWVSAGVVYFCNFADQRLYRLLPGSDPQPLTEAGPYRYADGVVDRARGRILCVREDHSRQGEPENSLVSIDLESGSQRVLASGHNFYANPRLSPDGQTLVWLTWDHPQMPWDGTELWRSEVNPDGSLGEPQKLAGGPAESIFQPQWSPEGDLYFVSDRSGWWNLYRWDPQGPIPLCPMEAEFGEPQWVFGLSTYGFCGDGRILACYEQDGLSHLAYLDPHSGQLAGIPLPYTQISGLQVSGEKAAFLAGSPTEATALVCLDLPSSQVEVVARSSSVAVDPDYLSIPEPIVFPTGGGKEVAYAFFYPPKNRDFVAPAGEKPPLLVKSHGGPTGATAAVLNLGIQYWTSRGIAVLDVNYRGSSGYGRAYRDALKGRWGLVDVEDCIAGSQFLAEQGKVDGERLLIQGGSAGGYTTLAALTFHSRLPSRCQLLRGERSRSPSPGDPQVRVSLLGQPHWPLPRAAGSLPGAFPHSSPGGPQLSGYLLSRLGRRHRAPQSGGEDGGSPTGQRDPSGLCALRGRATRLSPGGQHQTGFGGRALLLCPGVGVSAGRTF
jgi:hypothetical protein